MVGKQSLANIKILLVFNILSFGLWIKLDLGLIQLYDLGAWTFKTYKLLILFLINWTVMMGENPFAALC